MQQESILRTQRGNNNELPNIPTGQSDLELQLNAVQSLVAVKRDGKWRTALFQNTPAQFHGRPELVQKLTEELRQLL